MRNPCGWLVTLLLISGMTPAAALGRQDGADEEICTASTQSVEIEVARQERAITLEEAERIQRVVEQYLAKEKPPLDPAVIAPGEPFIDRWCTLRMGAWILESAHSDEPELRLTFRLVTNERLIVREIIALREEDGLWVVKGTSRQFAHRRPEP